MRKPRLGFLSVLPSPYQRDLFEAIVAADWCDLTVHYQQTGAADSPWDACALRGYERQLPGWGFDLGGARIQFNRQLPEPDQADVWVVNAALTSPSAQWFMRHLQGHRWLYWAERIRPSAGVKAMAQASLARVLEEADGIVAIGLDAQADYRRRFPQQRVWNIPYHCETEVYLDLPPRPPREGTTFLFCGQMIERKGIDVLLQAFAALARERNDVHLLLVGREDQLARHLGQLSSDVRGRIEYAGFRQTGELPSFFQRADVFVLPSRYDGWGVVMNQALAAGLPIICTDAVGAGRDLIFPNENGVVVPRDDVSALNAAMGALARDRTLAQAWGRRSREAAADWTPQAGVCKWKRVIQEVFREQRQEVLQETR